MIGKQGEHAGGGRSEPAHGREGHLGVLCVLVEIETAGFLSAQRQQP